MITEDQKKRLLKHLKNAQADIKAAMSYIKRDCFCIAIANTDIAAADIRLAQTAIQKVIKDKGEEHDTKGKTGQAKASGDRQQRQAAEAQAVQAAQERSPRWRGDGLVLRHRNRRAR